MSMLNTTLTKKQKEVYDFIADYIRAKKESPTIPEIAKAMNLKSLRSVTQYLETLELKGLIKREKSRARNIRLLREDAKEGEIVQLPVFASAGCGVVTAQRIFDEFINISANLIKGLNREKVYVIRAVGDSMQKADINSGDYVLVQEISEGDLNNGDTVVAIIEDDAVIKRYLKANEAVILNPESENKAHKPIILDQNSVYRIFGKVLKIIKLPQIEELEYIKIPNS